jgi:hypothetical protein
MNLANLIFVHSRLANTAWLFMLILAVWNLANYVRGRGVDGSVIGAVVVGELLMLTQAGLGLTIWLGYGLSPASLIHFLYGSLTLLALPALWVYTRGATDRRASLIWALAGLFMFGLALRAIGTAT